MEKGARRGSGRLDLVVVFLYELLRLKRRWIGSRPTSSQTSNLLVRYPFLCLGEIHRVHRSDACGWSQLLSILATKDSFFESALIDHLSSLFQQVRSPISLQNDLTYQ